jgi:hypothetical protein
LSTNFRISVVDSFARKKLWKEPAASLSDEKRSYCGKSKNMHLIRCKASVVGKPLTAKI